MYLEILTTLHLTVVCFYHDLIAIGVYIDYGILNLQSSLRFCNVHAYTVLIVHAQVHPSKYMYSICKLKFSTWKLLHLQCMHFC